MTRRRRRMYAAAIAAGTLFLSSWAIASAQAIPGGANPIVALFQGSQVVGEPGFETPSDLKYRGAEGEFAVVDGPADPAVAPGGNWVIQEGGYEPLVNLRYWGYPGEFGGTEGYAPIVNLKYWGYPGEFDVADFGDMATTRGMTPVDGFLAAPLIAVLDADGNVIDPIADGDLAQPIPGDPGYEAILPISYEPVVEISGGLGVQPGLWLAVGVLALMSGGLAVLLFRARQTA